MMTSTEIIQFVQSIPAIVSGAETYQLYIAAGVVVWTFLATRAYRFS